MPLPGTRLGPYEIGDLLGAGGMGEVYRAHDTRLRRDVAIKVLPAQVSADPERTQRFEREARAIAALNHPHICTLHDVGHHEGVSFLVMELLDGSTLGARLERGPLPLSEALDCAIQIADALDTAHRAGIVHRDLKPGNIFLLRSRTGRQGVPHVKLLDFGLAKLGTDRPILGAVPTGTDLMTVEGQILGTLNYMAPEQLEGRTVDARADIFAFGAVVVEMIAGRRAFGGSSPANVVASILRGPPPPFGGPAPDVPPVLRHLLEVCLAKDPERRWSSIHDVLLQLRPVAEERGTDVRTSPAPGGRRKRLAWAAAALIALIALALAGFALAGRGSTVPASAGPHLLSMIVPDDTIASYGDAPQLSPDGRRIAFVARDGSGSVRVYVRELDSEPAQPLPGTEEGALPFWAPDSRRIGFFAQGQLKVTALAGGKPLTLAGAPVPRGGTWSRDDVILFVAVPNRPPFRVSAAGGPATPVPVTGGEGTPAFRWVRSFPKFLPDGRHYLYLGSEPSGRRSGSIWVGDLDSDESRELVSSTASALYAAPGYLLFRREGALVAQPFDPATRTLGGSPAPIAADIGFNPITYQALFSASDTGAIAYQDSSPGSRLTWFDRDGRPVGPATPPGNQNNFCLAGDDRIVYEVADPLSNNVDLWVAGGAGGAPARLTFDPSIEFYPVCSPDGREIVFASLRGGPPNLYRLALEAPGGEVALLPQADAPRIPNDWSRDGRLVVYSTLRPDTSWNVEVLSLADGITRPVAATAAEERHGRLSPDGTWIAYVSNEGGTFNVYVQRFPPTESRWQVSGGGGLQPQWSPDGKELYYITAAGSLVGVPVTAGTAAMVFGEPRVLIEARVTGWEPTTQTAQYAVTADGRILVNTATDAIRSLSVILDWPRVMSR